MQAQSTESSWLYDFLAWLEVNKKRVLAGIIVLLVAGVAVAAYILNKEQAEKNANEALFAITPSAGASRTLPEPEKYLKVAQDHPNTSAAARAQLLAAAAAFNRGDYATAQAQFEKFLNDHRTSELRSQAAFGSAAVLEAQGKTDAAISKYEEVAREYSKEPVAPQAKLAIGRLYETANNPEKALKIYSEIEAAPGPFDAWKSEAANRSEKLVARHPELREQAAANPTEQIFEVTTPPADNP